MTDIRETIRADWTQARKDRDKLKATLLGTLVGSMMTKEKTFSPARTLTEAEVVAEVKKMLASLVETGQMIAGKEGRETQITDNATEQRLLEAYLPKQMSDDDLEAFIEARREQTLGQIMAALKQQFPGQYDGKQASTLAKRILTA